MNITRNLAIAEQNPSNVMDQTGSLSTCSVPTQQQYHTSYKKQFRPSNQNNFKKAFKALLTESNNYEQRLNSQTISMSTSSIGQNSTIPSNPLYQTSELPQQGHSQPTQQDSQQQPQKPKIRIGISIKPKNNRRGPILQKVTKETLSPILTKLLNSVRQAISTNEQQLQENHSEHALVNENHLNVNDTTLQTDKWMEEETPSAHHGANSDSDTVTDHEVISDHEMSADEAPIERTNNFYGPGTSGSSCADRPIAAQNSTLQNDTSETYNKLMGAVKEFNSAQNLASNSSSSSNRTEEVSPRENSSNTNQYSMKVANNPLKRKRNSLWRFVLPLEYDPHDTKWTLKYRTNLPGLVELVPQSRVYISYGDLKYCQQVSKDCKSLALRLLPAVFSRNALSVCLSMTERAKASDNVGSNTRPKLDDHACSVLLNFVLEHGLQRGWNTDLQPILSTLHSKIQEIRFKYGVMVEC